MESDAMTRRIRSCGGLLLAATCTLATPAAVRSQAPPEPRVVNFRDVAWGPPGSTPRFPPDVQTFQLGVDPANGGPTYLARFPAGSHFDLHWHTHSEYAVVMSGAVTIVLGDETHALTQGDYVVIPGAMNHSWDVPTGEAVVILVRRDGPADFNFVDR
jgi:quercetin dioxygenase-like cupin family protein